MKRYIIQVSGGKDSTAVLLNVGYEYFDGDRTLVEPVFCDTGWEAKETYEYLDYLESKLKIKILRLKPKLDFVELAKKKKRFPSTNARFCTSELKVKPFIDWLLTQEGDFRIYQGIRADESKNRAQMNIVDDYFKLQKGDYRIKDVRKWLEKNSAIVCRPIFHLSSYDVFKIHKDFNIEPNPLYKQGFSRVGCMPCIMCRHSEMKLIIENRPDDYAKIQAAEKEVGRTFFPPDYIATKKIATVEDVSQYLVNPNQLEAFERPTGCISVYNICE